MDIRELNEVTTKFIVYGEEVEVNPQANVKRTLLEKFRELGITSTPIFVDGEEVLDANDLPDVFEGHTVEIKKYMKAGC